MEQGLDILYRICFRWIVCYLIFLFNLQMVEIIIVYFMYVFYTCMRGMKDGILYSLKGADAFKFNEHILYTLESIIIFMFIPMAKQLEWADIVILSISIPLSFSFWHNGVYYETRKAIDVPYYHFMYNYSAGSTARFEIKWITRLILKISSVLFLGLYLIILK
jgi:hypothetical protein